MASELPLLGQPGNWEELEQSYAALQTWLGGLSSSIAALTGSTALTPVGGVMAFGAATPPTGWLLCNGAAVSRATYAALFLVISTTYGVGDGATTFNLPDLQQRVPLGKAASGTGNTLGATGGAIDHTHTGGTVSGSTANTSPGTDSQGSHSHTGSTGNESSHTHGTSGLNTNSAPTGSLVASSGSAINAGSHTHTITGNTDAGSAHSHSISSDGSHSHTVNSHLHAAGTLAVGTSGTANPPYQVVNYIVYAGV